MDPPEFRTSSFIIKVWIEETADETGRTVWRGHITHVPSGKRHYLKDLNDIAVFIVPYLAAMGVKIGIRWRMRQWLNR